MGISLKATDKCPSPLEEMRRVGWTNELLVQHGYAVEVAEDVPPILVEASDGKKYPVAFPAPVQNPFGVTKLEQVNHVYNAFSPIKNFPGGYSLMQHILLVAIELSKGKK